MRAVSPAGGERHMERDGSSPPEGAAPISLAKACWFCVRVCTAGLVMLAYLLCSLVVLICNVPICISIF